MFFTSSWTRRSCRKIRFPSAHDIRQVGSSHCSDRSLDWPSRILDASFSCDFSTLNLFCIYDRSYERGTRIAPGRNVHRVDGQLVFLRKRSDDHIQHT